MDRLNWLDTATKKIYFRPDRKAVRRELEAHLEDLREASGLDEDAALKEMGDPEIIAEELGRLHRPWLGYLWRASQLALLGAAVMFCLVTVLLATGARRSDQSLPLANLFYYLRPEYGTMERLFDLPALEQRELPAGAVLRAGGYTIRNNRAVYRQVSGEDGPQWDLYVDLAVTTSRWEEPLDVWNVLSGVRTDRGDKAFRISGASVDWGFWQKYAIELKDMPEDAAWVELDLGYGEWKRTLHFDLTEEAET